MTGVQTCAFPILCGGGVWVACVCERVGAREGVCLCARARVSAGVLARKHALPVCVCECVCEVSAGHQIVPQMFDIFCIREGLE